MQPIASRIVLQCSDQSEIKSYNFSAQDTCALLHEPFEVLIKRRQGANLPCIIARVKDLAGKVHLFEGCATEASQAFSNKGFFKVDGKLYPAASIRSFELKTWTPGFYLFFEKSYEDFADVHANGKSARVSQKGAEDKRTLLILGEAYKTAARSCFEKALSIEPSNQFAQASIAELDDKIEEEVTTGIQALAIAEEASEKKDEASIVTVSKPKRDECSCQLL